MCMPCSHANGNTDQMRIDRREFMKSAVAIGGLNALAAVNERTETSPPAGTDDVSSLPNRQFAWNAYVPKNDIGIPKMPKHQMMFHLDYVGNGIPTESERDQVERALQTLERAYEWSNEGLLFTLSYSPAYFDRFDEQLPPNVGLIDPQTVIDTVDLRGRQRRGAEPGQNDAHLHLASASAEVLLEAEAALMGNLDEINNTTVQSDFTGVLDPAIRRTGFVGAPLPHDKWEQDIDDQNPIPETAPLFFGFKTLFRDSQPTEDDVAIMEQDHPFFDGTTQQVSLLRDTRIPEWYNEYSHDKRVKRMFSPHHSSEDTGQHGDDLGTTSGTDDITMEQAAALTEQDAEEKGIVGHAQKLARARDPKPPLLRRDSPSTDRGDPHLNFISHQRTIDDFISLREQMSFVTPENEDTAYSELRLDQHGIQAFILTQHRATFLTPPRDLRALPTPTPEP
jgi:hypothetical protein